MLAMRLSKTIHQCKTISSQNPLLDSAGVLQRPSIHKHPPLPLPPFPFLHNRAALLATSPRSPAVVGDAVIAAAALGVALVGVILVALGFDGISASADDAVAAVDALLEALDALASVGGAGAREEGVARVVGRGGGARESEGDEEEDGRDAHFACCREGVAPLVGVL